MSISNYAENAILDAVLNNTSFAGGATLKLALHTADPGETGSGAEVSGGSYARQTITFGAASGGTSTMSNSGGIEFADMPSCTVTHVAIWNGAGSQIYWSGALTSSRTVTAGDSLRITSLTVSLD